MKKLLLLLITLGSIKLSAQSDEKKAERLDSIFTAYSANDMFTGSVLISKKGKVLLSKGYGMADYGKGVANAPETKFKLASVTKQFTAMSIMILQEKGKLNTEDKLSKYIKDYPNGDKITIHHLLTHTSGIHNMTSLPKFDSVKAKFHTLDQTIALTKNMPLDFEPGTKFNYSNSGYVILTDIIEKASGQKYGEFVKKNIFDPLGMKNSGLCDSKTVLKDAALPHSMGDKGYEISPFIDMSIPSGAGALYSTVNDLFLWDQALYTEKLVKKSTMEKIFTPFKDGYAYGWKIDTYKGHKWISHNGGIEGFATTINRFTDDEMAIIVLKNVDNQTLFAPHKIARAVMFDQPYELPKDRKVANIDRNVFKKLLGDYELQPGFVMTVTTENNKLFVQATGQQKAEIFPESEFNYFSRIVDAQFTFDKDEKGNITALTLHQGGGHMPAKKIK